MFRELFIEYIRGLISSLRGFVAFYKLDRERNEAKVAKQSSVNKLVGQQTTVLERRRQKDIKFKTFACSREIPPRLSTFQRVLRCIFANICVVCLTQLLALTINAVGPSILSSLIQSIGLLLLLPLFLAIRLLSTLWFADVAGAAVKYRRINGKTPDISRAASDFVHACLMELVFLVQAMFLYYIAIPIVSTVLGFVCMALLHALYSFDYCWMASGISLNTRIALIEENWPYYFGFGTILTLATSLSHSFVVNGCIFGALFPFFIVSGFLVDVDLGDIKRSDNACRSKIPPIHFFICSQSVTNKISVALSGSIYC